MQYTDFFSIDQDYSPTMNRETIDSSPRMWLNFYPHESFVKLLQLVLGSLDGGNKSVWLAAPYGTGKSHAALVLQKLFMDDESRVDEWFEKRRQQVPDTLRNMLKKQREKNVLVVFDSGSDGITRPEQFLVRVEKTITDALKAKGYTIPLLGTLDSILDRIHEEEAAFFRTRDSIQSELCHLTPNIITADALAKSLKNPKLVDGLLSDIMLVMHARSIYLDLNSENLLQWIYAAMNANGISKIWFIWDEFSTYIERNRGQLKTLEELAEASQQGRFFFMPVTHKQLESYFADSSEGARKANDRFLFCTLDMPTNTALALAADAFKIPDLSKWEQERVTLWHGISSVITHYMADLDEDCKAKPELFKGILPLHPMTAFVLKFLSTSVGSNQRSMFTFLKGNVGESEFQRFISEGGPDVSGKQYLTVDYLWRYFIEREDLGIDRNVIEVRNQYTSKSHNLDPAEQRVFKAVLLYSLLGRMLKGGHDLTQPLLENVVRCFEGDGGIVGVENIARELEKKHCFSIINNRCEMFRESGNSADLEKQKEKNRLLFHEQFCLRKAQPKLESKVKQFKDKLHFETRCSTESKATIYCQSKKDPFSDTGNKVLLHFIIAKDSSEQLLVQDRAKQLAVQMKEYRMLFIVVPNLHFCSDKESNWDDYVDQLAHIDLAVDQSAKISFVTQVELMDNEWLNKLTRNDQTLEVYIPNPNGEPYVKQVQWLNLDNLFKDYLKEKFTCFVDDLSDYNQTGMGEMKGLAGWAMAGMNFASAKGASNNIVKAFKKREITDNTDWFVQNPSSPLTRLRDFCKDKLNNALQGPVGCSVRKIYIDLRRPPFGLLGVPYTAFVMGFVMKEWLNNPRQQLQWSNGAMSSQLDEETLAEMIESAIKDDGNNSIKNEKIICRQSPEEKEFIKSAPVMFGIEKEVNITVEAMLSRIESRLERISEKVPLWVLPHYIEAQNDPQSACLKTMIDNLCVALSISSQGDQQNKINRIKEVGKELKATAGLAERFSQYIHTTAFTDAFKIFVDKQRPSLRELAQRVGDTTDQYCRMVKDRFAKTASWLWKEQDVDKDLVLTEMQYRIVAVVERILGLKAFLPYSEAMNRVHKAMYETNKIPLLVLAEDYPFLTRFVQAIESSGVADGLKDLAEIFEAEESSIREIFFDPGQGVELQTLRKRFSQQICSLNDESVKELYEKLSSGANRSEDDFKNTVLREIDDYLKASIGNQLKVLWKQKTGCETLEEWRKTNRMPTRVLFNDEAVSQEIIPVLSRPQDYGADKLKATRSRLESIDFPTESVLPGRFLKLVLPKKYQTWGIEAWELIAFLEVNVSMNPEQWTPIAVAESIDRFIRNKYKTNYKTKAVSRVNALSDAEAKRLLLQFVENNPDVGLQILE